jgi:predicted Rossmann-fold nucleotide-binding protein
MWEIIQEERMKVMYHTKIQEEEQPLISPEDLDLISFVDHPDDAVQIVLKHYDEWKKQVWSKLNEKSQETILNS